MPTNNIIVLDSYFNLTNKSILIDRLIRFFDHLVVAYFFGPPMTQIQPACFRVTTQEASYRPIRWREKRSIPTVLATINKVKLVGAGA